MASVSECLQCQCVISMSNTLLFLLFYVRCCRLCTLLLTVTVCVCVLGGGGGGGGAGVIHCSIMLNHDFVSDSRVAV